jgi:YHS domain-containing protein
MTQARDVVERYLAASYSGDAHAARRYLADDLAFAGPGAAFSTADAYLRASAHAMGAMQGAETHKVFVDGPDAGGFHFPPGGFDVAISRFGVMFFADPDLHLDHPVGSLAIASWYHVEGDKIASIRTISDAAPFAAGPGGPSGETAVNPVCGMAVPTAAAAAARSHAGTTYYFCSPGCAAAFEQEPERYLAGR